MAKIVHGSHGRDYLVSKESCTCGDFRYRKKDIGGKCKHMEELEE